MSDLKENWASAAESLTAKVREGLADLAGLIIRNYGDLGQSREENAWPCGYNMSWAAVLYLGCLGLSLSCTPCFSFLLNTF